MKLKLEKQTNGFKLSVKSRSPFFTKDLMIALTLASLLHFGAFSLFHVELVSFFPSIPAAAMHVITDSTSKHLLNAEEEVIEVPSFLKIHSNQFPSHTAFKLDLSPKEIALIPTSIDLQGLDLETGVKKSCFHLSRGHSFIEQPLPLFSKKLCKATLEFKASAKDGKIFWVSWLESTQDSQLDAEILMRIQSAEIKGSSASIALSGIIEVEFAS